ncbi:MAG TPA: hypothetical protein VGL86_09610 [Polyangia bacterium]|jgi:hypothetical protein
MPAGHDAGLRPLRLVRDAPVDEQLLVLSTYYGGKHRGIRETRRTLSFGPTGVSGTF